MCAGAAALRPGADRAIRASFRQPPNRIVLDIDDTFDRVHGGQQLRLFNAFHDDYGFQSIVVFDGEGRFVTAMLRPGKRPRCPAIALCSSNPQRPPIPKTQTRRRSDPSCPSHTSATKTRVAQLYDLPNVF